MANNRSRAAADNAPSSGTTCGRRAPSRRHARPPGWDGSFWCLRQIQIAQQRDAVMDRVRNVFSDDQVMLLVFGHRLSRLRQACACTPRRDFAENGAAEFLLGLRRCGAADWTPMSLMMARAQSDSRRADWLTRVAA